MLFSHSETLPDFLKYWDKLNSYYVAKEVPPVLFVLEYGVSDSDDVLREVLHRDQILVGTDPVVHVEGETELGQRDHEPAF